MHYGRVTVTEIGKYKIEIAFHGDAINTAARIQGQCNALNAELLISKKLKSKLDNEQLKPQLPMDYTSKGMVSLKGKKKELEIYAVQQLEQPYLLAKN